MANHEAYKVISVLFIYLFIFGLPKFELPLKSVLEYAYSNYMVKMEFVRGAACIIYDKLYDFPKVQ